MMQPQPIHTTTNINMDGETVTTMVTKTQAFTEGVNTVLEQSVTEGM